MADAASQRDLEAQRQEVRRLMASGMTLDQAAAQVRGSAAPQQAKQGVPAVPKSKMESLGRGALQGATFGFADEASASLGAALQKVAGDPESYADVRRRYLDEERAGYRGAQESNPKTYLAGQIGGGIASTAITAPLLPAATTLGGATASGAAYGALYGLGESEADLTKGEVGRAAADTAIGGALGGALGAAGYGLAKGFGAIGRRVMDRWRGTPGGTTSAAGKAAGNVATNLDEPSMIGGGQTIRTATEKANALQDEWSGMLGEKMRLRPSQITGDPALALAESKVSQFPQTMMRAQAEDAKRLSQSAKILDMYVDGIAKDPSRLGRSDVGEQLTGAVQRHIDDLVATRSRVAGELFGEVDQIAGRQRIVKMGETAQTIAGLIDEMRSPLSTGQSRAAIAELEGLSKSLGSDDAMFTARELQNALSDWGKKAASSGDTFKDMDRATSQRISKQIFAALQSDLDNAAGSAEAGAAGQALARARDSYRTMSQAIDEASTDTVRRLLKAGGTDSADKITARLLSSSPDEVSGVFSLLNKADPDAAQQLRAQLLDDILIKGGKPNRAAPMAAEKGIAAMSPRSTLSALEKAEPMLQAAYAGDPKARLALSRTYDLLQRLDFGPGIKGSQTAPLAAQVMEGVGDTAAAAVAGPHGAGVLRGIRSFLTNERAQAEALTTARGIDDFNRFLDAELGARQGRALSADAARALSSALTIYGMDIMQPKEPRPQPARRGSF